eukprot:TRINITY_DN13322_c0_g1_i1.p2 TRINITY_DN13322_c0_g1~~TRINITY_DN13322_c0_g1_i1.p2  ORF type:complete len:112 (+),score=29.47 TRINITY_DN13322_c0_g1_i1:1422-1757(+)
MAMSAEIISLAATCLVLAAFLSTFTFSATPSCSWRRREVAVLCSLSKALMSFDVGGVMEKWVLVLKRRDWWFVSLRRGVWVLREEGLENMEERSGFVGEEDAISSLHLGFG